MSRPPALSDWTPENEYLTAIVRVSQGQGSAAGCQIAPGFILTAHHVCSGNGHVTYHDEKTAPARMVAGSRAEDWAILQTAPRADIYSYEMISGPVTKGAELTIAGFPYTRNGGYRLLTIRATGHLGGWWEGSPGVIQGDSGGPVLHGGKVMGVVAGYDNRRNSIGPSILQIRQAAPNIIQQIERARNDALSTNATDSGRSVLLSE